MSSNYEGFTEDDQARIAEEVQGRVSGRRTGLGFGGSFSPPQVDLTSSTGSTWFHQTLNDSDTFESAKSNCDTTQGAYPWDGGHRGKTGGAAKKNAAAAILPPGEAPSAGGRTREREFPMIRDRDIERSKDGRDGKRSTSRSASKDRGKRSSGRDREKSGWRSRSRSRSRDRGRDSRREMRLEAKTQYERERRRDRERDRGWDRERYRDRGKDARRSERMYHSPARDVRDASDRSDGPKTSNGGARRRDFEHVQTSKEPRGKTSSSIPTVEKTKVAMKRRLQQVASADASLKAGFTATFGGGAGWERAEMSIASDFFKNDEVAAKGGVASVAPEYEARLAEILAVEDEDTMCLGDGIRKNVASASAGQVYDDDLRTKAHHDAIFAPKGSEMSQSLSTTRILPSESPTAKVSGRMTSNTGGIGAAARARLALKGKIKEATLDLAKSVSSKASKKLKGMMDDSPAKCQGVDEPLFKTLRVGDSVEARYTANDEWYKSTILQVIHGGFEIARYKVRYTDYGNEETLSWKRIRHISSPEITAKAEEATVPTSIPAFPQSLLKCKSTEADKLSETFAGMRPRSIYSEKQEEKVPEQEVRMEDTTPEQPDDVNVVNPTILSTAPGQKLSWKEKLKARKAAANKAHESSTDVNPLQKQISLVPDFAAQKREREAENFLDKSDRRAKVVFGIGGSKKKDR